MIPLLRNDVSYLDDQWCGTHIDILWCTDHVANLFPSQGKLQSLPKYIYICLSCSLSDDLRECCCWRLEVRLQAASPTSVARCLTPILRKSIRSPTMTSRRVRRWVRWKVLTTTMQHLHRGPEGRLCLQILPLQFKPG